MEVYFVLVCVCGKTAKLNPSLLTYIAGVVLEELKVLAAALAVVDHVFLQHCQDAVDDAGNGPPVCLAAKPQTALDRHR